MISERQTIHVISSVDFLKHFFCRRHHAPPFLANFSTLPLPFHFSFNSCHIRKRPRSAPSLAPSVISLDLVFERWFARRIPVAWFAYHLCSSCAVSLHRANMGLDGKTFRRARSIFWYVQQVSLPRASSRKSC